MPKTSLILILSLRFTHSDPFEDTERSAPSRSPQRGQRVSPTPIRLRILKAYISWEIKRPVWSFTHSDPFEDTESIITRPVVGKFLQVSPTPIRLRILKAKFFLSL